MSKVNEQKLVTRGTATELKRMIESSRSIYKHGYGSNDLFQLVIPYMVLDESGESIPGMMPSWQFFLEFTGVQPNIEALEVLGEFPYDLAKTVEENIAIFIQSAISSGSFNETEFQMRPLQLSVGITAAEVRAWVGLSTPEEQVQKDFLMKSFVDKFMRLKKSFIEHRTAMMVDYGLVGSISEKPNLGSTVARDSFSGEYHQGVFLSKEEPLAQRLNQISKMVNTFVTRYYEINFAPSYASLPTKEKQTKLKEYRSAHNIASSINYSGILYWVEIPTRDQLSIKEDKSPQLKYFDCGAMGKQSSYSKLIGVIKTSELHQDFDFAEVVVQYPEFSSDKEKGQAGLARTFGSIPNGKNLLISREDIYKLFDKVIFGNCIESTEKWKLLDPSKVEELTIRWLEQNMQFIKTLPQEVVEPFGEFMDTFIPGYSNNLYTKFQVDLGPAQSTTPTPAPVQTPAQTPVGGFTVPASAPAPSPSEVEMPAQQPQTPQQTQPQTQVQPQDMMAQPFTAPMGGFAQNVTSPMQQQQQQMTDVQAQPSTEQQTQTQPFTAPVGGFTMQGLPQQ